MDDALDYLHAKLKTDIFKKYKDSYNKYHENFSFQSDYKPFFDKSNEDKLSKRFKYFESIIQNEVLCRCSQPSNKIDEESNIYCSEKLLNNALQIFLFFPTWTNILQNKHNSQWDFNKYKILHETGQKHCLKIKNEVFKEQSTMEASSFVKEFGVFLRKACQENRMLLDDPNFNGENEQNSEFSHSYLRHQDNWKGRVQRNENIKGVEKENGEKSLHALKKGLEISNDRDIASDAENLKSM